MRLKVLAVVVLLVVAGGAVFASIGGFNPATMAATTLLTATAAMADVIDDTTTYHAQSDASPDDVATGGKVLVRVNLRAPGGSGSVTNPSASDVTVVP